MIEYPMLMVFPAAMAFAASMDLVTMTIPNRVSLALAAAFLILAPFAGLSLSQFGLHLAAGAMILAAGIAMFSLGWVGGGDAKLLAAAALWMGFDHLLPYLLQVAIVGGGLSIAVLAYRKYVPLHIAMRAGWAERLHAKESGIPYGIAIAGGGLLIYPSTAWFTAFTA